jgi:hypothetical protein
MSHGFVALDCGTDQIPYLSPMDSPGSASYLPHGYVAYVHGAAKMFSVCPMGVLHWTMGSSLGQHHICPMGMLHMSMGQPKCSVSVPWVCCTGPWGLLWVSIISAPWVCCICPWGNQNVQSLSHRPPWVSITTHPWVCSIDIWGRPRLQPLAHGLPQINNAHAPWVCSK